jgi:hypothetical protein
MTEIDKDVYHSDGKKRKKKKPALDDDGNPIIEPKRTEVIHVRLFPDEKKMIDDKVIASGRSTSELIRAALDDVQVAPLENAELQKEVIREVRRVGINMNQIARACHVANKNNDEINFTELIILLKSIESGFDLLMKSNSPPAPSFDVKSGEDDHVN